MCRTNLYTLHKTNTGKRRRRNFKEASESFLEVPYTRWRGNKGFHTKWRRSSYSCHSQSLKGAIETKGTKKVR